MCFPGQRGITGLYYLHMFSFDLQIWIIILKPQILLQAFQLNRYQ